MKLAIFWFDLNCKRRSCHFLTILVMDSSYNTIYFCCLIFKVHFYVSGWRNRSHFEIINFVNLCQIVFTCVLIFRKSFNLSLIGHTQCDKILVSFKGFVVRFFCPWFLASFCQCLVWKTSLFCDKFRLYLKLICVDITGHMWITSSCIETHCWVLQ